MRKALKGIMASLLCTAIIIGPLNSVHAESEEHVIPPVVSSEETQLLDLTTDELQGAENIVVVEEFNEIGQLETKTTYDDGTVATVEINSNENNVGSLPSLPMGKDQPSNAIVNEGSMSYVLIDSFSGSSKVIATINNWIYQFGAAFIPAKFFKTNWAGAAGSATYNTFLPPPTVKYYKTWVYQAQDSYNYYGKTVSKKYSDSARTKLEKTTTFISRIPK